MLHLVGNTPMIKFGNVNLKLEFFNPTGSHKDRTAFYMIKEAMERGLKPGDTVVEYTSGNTGISVAWVALQMHLKSIILVPEGTSGMKINLIKLFGAEIINVPEDIDGHILAEEIATERGGTFLAQTRNMANFKAHYETTGPEIAKQAPDTEVFVMGAGTGGTVYGAGKYLKEHLNAEIVLLLPRGSLAQEQLSGEKEEDLEIMEGFTYHSFPELIQMAIDENVVDQIIYVSAQESIEGMDMLRKMGIPGGPTSGANYYHARKIAESGKRCTTIVADKITRYPEIIKEIIN
ncbi:MAG: cysteine synthase family protein [Euryarchaeota archaeon]|nr:cysteine synthase family protein [Euryarchaeota archaeon]